MRNKKLEELETNIRIIKIWFLIEISEEYSIKANSHVRRMSSQCLSIRSHGQVWTAPFKNNEIIFFSTDTDSSESSRNWYVWIRL